MMLDQSHTSTKCDLQRRHRGLQVVSNASETLSSVLRFSHNESLIKAVAFSHKGFELITLSTSVKVSAYYL